MYRLRTESSHCLQHSECLKNSTSRMRVHDQGVKPNISTQTYNKSSAASDQRLITLPRVLMGSPEAGKKWNGPLLLLFARNWSSEACCLSFRTKETAIMTRVLSLVNSSHSCLKLSKLAAIITSYGSKIPWFKVCMAQRSTFSCLIIFLVVRNPCLRSHSTS